ncbi:hypothetical protein JTB14_017394 [Gonioctena quinquepunctata]|nr:hypothetical protein JTB14_017394 [Gonioctena quinquepunctata]
MCNSRYGNKTDMQFFKTGNGHTYDIGEKVQRCSRMQEVRHSEMEGEAESLGRNKQRSLTKIHTELRKISEISMKVRKNLLWRNEKCTKLGEELLHLPLQKQILK